MADSSLQAIQNKVRRITRSLSENLLPEADLNQYINTFVLNDFPEELRLFNLKTTFSFYTLPYVDRYSTTNDENSPLYNFTNKYITTQAPIFIAGYQSLYSESRERFYSIYPLVNSIANIGTTGNGLETQFSGVINSQQANIPQGINQFVCLLQNNVLFSSVDINNNGLAMKDSPILDDVTGNPTNYGYLYNSLSTNEQTFPGNTGQIPVLSLHAPYFIQPGFPLGNYINYITGEYTVTFPTAPQDGFTINSQTVPMNPSLPQALLFFDGDFIVLPVPDQPYRIDMEVFVQPAELLSAGQTPELSEWWEYIAVQTCMKIFEDRMDMDSMNMLAPRVKYYENLINRRTIVQQTSQRTSTIYTEQTSISGAYGPGWGSGGGSF